MATSPDDGELDLGSFAPLRVHQHRMLTGGPQVVTADAITLFVDVAGFTPLTERLARAGSAGIEELTGVLAGFFGPATDLVVERGGDPVAFGGDALTVVFDGDTAANAAAAVEAAHGFVELAEAASVSTTSAGPVDVRVKVGVARGPVTTALAVTARRVAVVQLGAGLDRAVRAEERAVAGEVVVDRGVRALVDSIPTGRRRTIPRMRSEPVQSQELAGLVHPVIAARLAVGRSLLDSHRIVTAAFVRFPPVEDRDLPRFLRKITVLLDAITDADGSLVQVSGGDKGMVAMIVFGAPVAHADDPARAMSSLLSLRKGPLRAAGIGVATGPAFIGLHGSSSRRFTTHCGKVVNLAARLMQRAVPGEIVVDSDTAAETTPLIRWSEPESVEVKGFNGEIVTHRHVRWRRRSRSDLSSGGDTPIIGRLPELAIGERLLDRVVGGRGTVLAIEGEPGVGKSRLARELAVRARSRGMEIAAVEAEDHVVGRPGALWGTLLGGLLGMNRGAGRNDWAEAIGTLLSGVEDRLPLLGPFLGVSFTPTTLTRELPAELGDELVHDLVVQLLAAAAGRRPLLVVVDDAHRLDEASAALLRAVASRVAERSIGILVTRQPGAGDALAGLAAIEQLTLAELASDDVDVLVVDTWDRGGPGAPPPWLADAVRRRAGGNPMFVETATELLARLWEPGRPPPTDEVAAGRLSALVSERFDLLTPHARHVLGVLAIVQRPCARYLLAALLPDVFDTRTLERSLSELVAAGLLRVELGPLGERCTFQHSVARQVVYEQLSHAERVRLHRRVADQLEATHADAVEIAEHIRHLNDDEGARRWFPSAAREARSAWAISEAISWWQRVLPVLNIRRQRAAAIELAELLLIGGRPVDVTEILDAHRDRPDADDADGSLAGRAELARGEATFVLGHLEQAQAALGRAVRYLTGGDHVRYHQALELLARVEVERGNTDAAESIARAQLTEACAMNDERAIMVAHASLGAVLLLSGRAGEAADHFDTSRRVADAAGDVIHQIHATSDLAGARYHVGRYRDSIQLLTEARSLADRIGYRRHLAMSLNNEAEVRMCLGDPAAATCAWVATQRLLEMGDAGVSASAMHTWLLADPDHRRADAWRRLVAVERELGRKGALAEALAHLAQCLLDGGALADATRAAQRAADLACETSDDPTRRRATVVRAIAAGRSGDAEEASAILDELAAEDLAPDEAADVAYHRWRQTTDDRHRHEAIRRLELAFEATPSFVNRSRLAEVGASPTTPPIALDPPVGFAGPAPAPEVLEEMMGRLEQLVGITSSAPTSVR